MDTSFSDWLRTLNPTFPTRVGKVRHAVFDFDGTLSVLRQGWEPVMERMMLAALCPDGRVPEALAQEVRAYIDESTGQLTIVQMGWLAQAVRRQNSAQAARTPTEYKAAYLDALMVSVSQRLESLENGTRAPTDYLIAGSLELLRGLAERGVTIYIASGSDHAGVLREADALGITPYARGGIYGALDASEANAKARIIQRILDDHHLAGDELLVAGDGPVELIEARQRGALAVGVASDEVARQGWNEEKVPRLTRAGADALAPDYRRAAELVKMLVG